MAEMAIRAEGLTKRYGDSLALDDLDLEVPQGEVVGYLGPNGAGKTTTIRLLLGLSQPTSGQCRIFDLDCQHQTVEAHRRLAFVAGEASLWPSLTGAETLALLGRVHGRVDLAYKNELVDRFELDPTMKVRAYSKGNRQKVILISALMVRPDLLILDEPTSGLDPLMELAFRHCIGEARDRGQTVFLSSHIMSEVEALCDRVGILRAGKLIEMGTLSEMRHLSALSVEATLDGPIPDLSAIPGVSSVEIEGHMVRCQVRGPIGPLLKVLTDAGVAQLVSREPSLEELFLALYGGRWQCSLTSPCDPRRGRRLRAERSASIGRRPGDCPQSCSLGGPLGADLRPRHRVVGDQLRQDLYQRSSARRLGSRLRIEQGDECTLRSGTSAPDRGWLHGFQDLHDTHGPWCGVGDPDQHAVAPWRRGLRPLGSPSCGPDDTTAPRPLWQSAGFGAGAVTLWMTTAVITVLVGTGARRCGSQLGSSLYFALAMVATAVMFLAVGTVTSQLAATRRQAASIGAALLGVSYALRLIADAGVGFHGLIWASPLGWVEELQPLTSPQPLVFVPIVGFSALLAIGAVYPRRQA